jgi:hypothetical protein
MSAKGVFLKTGNRVDGRAGKRDCQLKPVAAFDLICVIYILPNFWKLFGRTGSERRGDVCRRRETGGNRTLPAAAWASRQLGNFQVVEECRVEARSQTNQPAVDGSVRA